MKDTYDNFAALYDAVLMQQQEETEQIVQFKKAVLVSAAPIQNKIKGPRFTDKRPHIRATINWLGMSKKHYAQIRLKMKSAKRKGHKKSFPF